MDKQIFFFCIYIVEWVTIFVYLSQDVQMNNSSYSISNLYLKEDWQTWISTKLVDLTSFI